MMTTTHSTRAVQCSRCGQTLDAATGGAELTPGSISVCLYCAHVTVFDVDEDGELVLRELDERESRLVLGSPQVRRVVDAVKANMADPSTGP